jgi:hypothetical protein
MTEDTIKRILLTVEAQRRGLPLPLDVLESVYGTNTACWYALRQRVADEGALEVASAALRADQAERVRVIISVVAKPVA